MQMINQKQLKEVLHYDPLSGIFIWKIKSARCIQIGDIAGYKDHGYIRIEINHKAYFANRLAFLYMEGYFPEGDVDHKDRIKDNNKWNNLRHVTRSCNMRNTKVFSTNTLEFG